MSCIHSSTFIYRGKRHLESAFKSAGYEDMKFKFTKEKLSLDFCSTHYKYIIYIPDDSMSSMHRRCCNLYRYVKSILNLYLLLLGKCEY